MAYKNQKKYTRFFTIFLVIAVFGEIGSVFFSFGIKSVFADTATDTVTCDDKGGNYTDSALPDATEVGPFQYTTCAQYCTKIEKTTVIPMTLSAPRDCCCKRPVAAAPTSAAAPKAGCPASNIISDSTAAKGKCGGTEGICVKKDKNKWKDGSLAGTGKCCCTPKNPPKPLAPNQCLGGDVRKCGEKGWGKIVKRTPKEQDCATICGENKENDVKLCSLQDTDTETVCCCGFVGISGAAVTETSSGVSLCEVGGVTTTCRNPLSVGGIGGINVIVSRVIKGALGIVGSLALFMFVWGGVLFLTAAGDDKRIKKGWNTMIWSTMGLILIFGAYVAAKFVLDAFSKSMT